MTSKQGKYGTLYAYRCRYVDYNPWGGRQSVCMWAYNAEHAAERAVDWLTANGDYNVSEFSLVSVERVKP